MYLRRVTSRMFDSPARYLDDPGNRADLAGYHSDLLGSRASAAGDARHGQSYGEMGEALLQAALSAREPVGLLVLAFAVPDVRPGRATATYLSLVCPGRPMAFAICDQGPAAAFTALRLAHTYLETGACERAAVLVMEQAALPHRPAVPVPLPVRHSGVALILDAGHDDAGHDSGTRLRAVRVHADVAPDRADALLRKELAGSDATVILGGGLSTPDGRRVRRAPLGQPDTGAWSELAGLFGQRQGPVVVASYDPLLRYLCLLDVG